MKKFFLVLMSFAVGLVLGFTVKTDVNPQQFDQTMEVMPIGTPSEFMWAGRLLSDPYLRDPQGKLVSTAQKYVEALTKFPDLRSCLKAPPPKPQALDILTFNWSNISSVSEFDVCVFHVANALHDIDRLAKWLDLSGFQVVSSVSAVYDRRSVDGGWPSKMNQSNSPFPRAFLVDWMERKLGVGNFSATIQLDQSDKVLSIQSGFNYE